MSEECVGPVLTIQCNGREAHLYLRDMARSMAKNKKGSFNGKCPIFDPCVAYEDQWVTPNAFVALCGLRDSRPAWKTVVYHSGRTMKALLQEGIITLKPLSCKCSACLKQKSRPTGSPSSRKKNNTKSKKKLIEVSTVFVCNVCDQTFRTKKNFEHHKKFSHLPALLPRGQVCIELSPDRSRDHRLSSDTNHSPSNSSSPMSSGQSQPTNSRWSTNGPMLRLTPVLAKQAGIRKIVTSTGEDPTPAQATPKRAHAKEISSCHPDSTSSPAPRKRARVTELTSTHCATTPEPPAAKREQRTKPAAAAGIDVDSTVAPMKATPSALAKQGGRLMIAENAFSGCTNRELLAELVERKACFPCICGIVYTDRALFYLHKGMHDQNNSKKCALCGYISKDWYDFSSHFLDHTNPEKEDDE